MNYTKGKWKAGYNPCSSGPTTPVEQPLCGKDWPYRTINIGLETIAIIPAQSINGRIGYPGEPIPESAEANANLICSTVNGCISVNPENPQAVAESIKDMFEALKAILLNREMGEYESQKRGLPRMIEVNDMGREALAKAEGK